MKKYKNKYYIENEELINNSKCEKRRYTKYERLSIGKLVYEKTYTLHQAAIIYQTNPYRIKKYYEEYKETIQ